MAEVYSTAHCTPERGDILDILCAREGIVSVVGAGGKKSTILRLVSAHSGKVGITSTVHTPPFRRRLNACQVIADESGLLDRVKAAASEHKRVAYAHPSDKPARLGGVSTQIVSRIHSDARFDATYVKADGARLRWLKAPESSEPVVPPDTRTLVPVISVRAIGKPLSTEIAHRPDEVAHIIGARIGDRITAVHLAKLLTSSNGSLKDAGDATVVAVLNMAENKEHVRLSQLVAELALDQSDKILRVVITSMVRDDPVLRVVGR